MSTLDRASVQTAAGQGGGVNWQTQATDQGSSAPGHSQHVRRLPPVPGWRRHPGAPRGAGVCGGGRGGGRHAHVAVIHQRRGLCRRGGGGGRCAPYSYPSPNRCCVPCWGLSAIRRGPYAVWGDAPRPYACNSVCGRVCDASPSQSLRRADAPGSAYGVWVRIGLHPRAAADSAGGRA